MLTGQKIDKDVLVKGDNKIKIVTIPAFGESQQAESISPLAAENVRKESVKSEQQEATTTTGITYKIDPLILAEFKKQEEI